MSSSIDDVTPRQPDEDFTDWPGLARVPQSTRLRVRAWAADKLFRRAASRLPVRVEYPDGSVIGARADSDILPRMIIRRPDAFAERVGARGLIGFGESYMAGDWIAPDLAGVLTIFASRMAQLVPAPLQRLRSIAVAGPPASELGSEENAQSNISAHYDKSNDLFALFLDSTMTYSSALFGEPQVVGTTDDRTDLVAYVADTPSWEELEAAQERKIDRLLDSAGVGPGSRVLEVGTGWGELCIRAASRGAIVRSVTLSREQQELALKRVAEAGHGAAVQVDLLDYRSVTGEYDAIVSVEMIEAVGHKHWATYFGALDKLLAPGGKVALQAITMPHDRMLATRNTYTWIQKYIFPGGFLPSTKAIETVAAKHTTLRVRERLALGPHYAETLRLWRERFDAERGKAAELGFDKVFRRMWQFYLGYSEAGFRSGYLDVEQLVLVRDEVKA